MLNPLFPGSEEIDKKDTDKSRKNSCFLKNYYIIAMLFLQRTQEPGKSL